MLFGSIWPHAFTGAVLTSSLLHCNNTMHVGDSCMQLLLYSSCRLEDCITQAVHHLNHQQNPCKTCMTHTGPCCTLHCPQGFYCVWPSQAQDVLVVGPYQGTLGCLRIPFSRGVCGAAARTQQTQLVPDVHSFEGHIACASRCVTEWKAMGCIMSNKACGVPYTIDHRVTEMMLVTQSGLYLLPTLPVGF